MLLRLMLLHFDAVDAVTNDGVAVVAVAVDAVAINSVVAIVGERRFGSFCLVLIFSSI